MNVKVRNLKINSQERHLPRAIPLCCRQVGSVGPCSTVLTPAEQEAPDGHFGWLTLDKTPSSETGHLQEPLLLSPILHRCFLQSCSNTSLPPAALHHCRSWASFMWNQAWKVDNLLESLTYRQDMPSAWVPSFGQSHLLRHYFRQQSFWQGTGRIAPGVDEWCLYGKEGVAAFPKGRAVFNSLNLLLQHVPQPDPLE